MDYEYYVKESLSVFIRIITILPLLLAMTIFMGRRSIGELPVIDFLVILTIGAVVGADIADPTLPHFETYFSVIVIALFQILASRLMIKSRRFGRLITFEPAVVIRDGQFLVRNMEKIRYSIDNLLVLLREKDVFDVREVDIAIIEANGKLSVYKKSMKANVKREDLGLPPKSSGIAYPLIVDGSLMPDVLRAVNLDEDWLHQELSKRGVADLDSVFFASLDDQQSLHISLKQDMPASDPPLHH